MDGGIRRSLRKRGLAVDFGKGFWTCVTILEWAPGFYGLWRVGGVDVAEVAWFVFGRLRKLSCSVVRLWCEAALSFRSFRA